MLSFRLFFETDDGLIAGLHAHCLAGRVKGIGLVGSTSHGNREADAGIAARLSRVRCQGSARLTTSEQSRFAGNTLTPSSAPCVSISLASLDVEHSYR